MCIDGGQRIVTLTPAPPALHTHGCDEGYRYTDTPIYLNHAKYTNTGSILNTNTHLRTFAPSRLQWQRVVSRHQIQATACRATRTKATGFQGIFNSIPSEK